MSQTQNRIDERFLGRSKPALFIPYITCGDPSLEVSARLLFLLEEAGADLIELGVPYSDPLADGPVIQEASMRALRQGVKLEDVLNLGARVRSEGLESGIILFSYYNPLLQYGLEKLIEKMARSGFDGFVVPDLPVEEAAELIELSSQAGIHFIPLVAPTSLTRLKVIVQNAQGMIYCVSSLGVTGMRQQFHDQLYSLLQILRTKTSLPLAVGFGISSYEQFSTLSDMCDGVVIGSAIVKEIHEVSHALVSPSQEERRLAEAHLLHFVQNLQGIDA